MRAIMMPPLTSPEPPVQAESITRFTTCDLAESRPGRRRPGERRPVPILKPAWCLPFFGVCSGSR